MLDSEREAYANILAQPLLQKVDRGLNSKILIREVAQALADGVSETLLTKLFRNIQYYPASYFYNHIPAYRQALIDLEVFTKPTILASQTYSSGSIRWTTKNLFQGWEMPGNMPRISYDKEEAPTGIEQLVVLDDHTITSGTICDDIFFPNPPDNLTQIAIVCNYTQRAEDTITERGHKLISLGDKINSMPDFLDPDELTELEQVNLFYYQKGALKRDFDTHPGAGTVAYFTSYILPDNLPVLLGKILGDSFQTTPEYDSPNSN